MFATTALISTCVFIRGASASPERTIYVDQAPRTANYDTLGMVAPTMGVEDGPCRNTPGNECNPGLTCHYYTVDGTSTQGRCIDEGRTGGWLQRCNRGYGPECNNDWWLVGVWDNDNCWCRLRMFHPGHQGRTGGANQKCNPAGQRPCNDDDLEAHYVRLLPSGTACMCQYILLGNSEATSDRTSASSTSTSTQSTLLQERLLASTASKQGSTDAQKSANPVLGLRAPQMGGQGEPCRNTPGNECNRGFYCKYTNHGSWFSGVCETAYMPQFGKLGQPCDKGQCDYGLYCKYTWHGSFSTNVCVKTETPRGHTGEQCNLLGSGQPECLSPNDYCKSVNLLPSGTVQICTPRNKAKEGEKCGNSSECESGLYCKTIRLLPSGTAQVCEKQDPAAEGGLNQPCRSLRTYSTECNNGLTCDYFALRGPTCVNWSSDEDFPMGGR